MATVHRLSLANRPCPACEASSPLVKKEWTTCVGTEGPHDPNCVSGVFECPNGHRFYATTQYECVCGWSGVRDCKINDHHQRWLLPASPANPGTAV